MASELLKAGRIQRGARASRVVEADLKGALETVVNLLLALASLVVIGVGLLEIKARLSPPTRFPINPVASEPVEGLEIAVSDAIIRGKLTAADPVLIEFSDYQCPFCGRFARETFAAIQHDFVAPGKIAYVFLNFPIENAHPHAFKAAEAAE